MDENDAMPRCGGSPLAPIKQAFEQIVADLDSAEEWAKRTNVGHIHGRIDQARMEARAALSLLSEMEKGAEVWWRQRKPDGSCCWHGGEFPGHKCVLVFPLPEPGGKP